MPMQFVMQFFHPHIFIPPSPLSAIKFPEEPQITFESYDDTNFGYLRGGVNAQTLRIEYHPASDGAQSKTPDDSVTVNLATYKLLP